jgi:hypothetical protein
VGDVDEMVGVEEVREPVVVMLVVRAGAPPALAEGRVRALGGGAGSGRKERRRGSDSTARSTTAV